MRYQNILVIGGSGFIGGHLLAALAERGIPAIVPTRGRERAKRLILLPTVDVVQRALLDEAAIERLAEDCDAVVNLAGVLHSRRGRPDERGPNDYGPDFARVHVELPQAIIAACRARGIKRLLHVSALGASPEAPSEYLRSKGVGEQLVLAAEDLDVTVFRPSVVFGPEDHFLNLFAGLSRYLPMLLVACPSARLQPVYVGDVVQAMMAALEERMSHEPIPFSQAYDLCGPRSYELLEIVRYLCALQGRRRVVLGLSEGMSNLMARLLEWTPGPLMTRDNLHTLSVANVCDGPMPFGIEARALEVMAPAWLRAQRN